MLEKLGLDGEKITVGAVCVYPNRVADAVHALQGSNIPVASVATGFPAGQTPLPQRIGEIEQAVEAGAKEIDVVIARNYVLTGDWAAMYDELQQFRKACGECAHEDHPCNWRLRFTETGLSSQPRGNDGRLGLYQDIHGQGNDQCHAGSESR